MDRAEELIKVLGLQEHSEGGYFKETFRSRLNILSPTVNDTRSAMTDIYFLLKKGQVSRFHQVRHDEVWNFYEGSPVQLYDYDPATEKMHIVLLGAMPQCDGYKYVIAGDHWQAAVSRGDYSLVGCIVAPGFDFRDFAFFAQNSNVKENLLLRYPELERFI